MYMKGINVHYDREGFKKRPFYKTFTTGAAAMYDNYQAFFENYVFSGVFRYDPWPLKHDCAKSRFSFWVKT